MTSPEKADLAAFNAQTRRAERAAIDAFVSAAVAGDPEALAAAIDAVDQQCVWREAMAAISGQRVPDDLRARFVSVWQKIGDSLRGDVDDDLVLIDGLRALLPKYTGEARLLYRGETAFNRRRRTYGLSWTDRIDVGEDFASKRSKDGMDGCLLETVAPPEAIICSPAELSARFEAEREFLVDRRKLGKVTVRQRFKA